MNKEARVHCYLLSSGEQKIWILILCRNLKEDREDHFISLLNHLSGVYIGEGREDEKVWNASKDGLFSVSSFFSTICRRAGRSSSVASLWKIKAPSRVVVFGWLALRNSILTMDNLSQRGKIVVNCCPMCIGFGGPPSLEF